MRSLSALVRAAPFWLSLIMVVLVWQAATLQGIWLLILPVFAIFGITALDALIGMNEANVDPNGTEDLFWYKAITWVWLPLQLAMIFGCIWWISRGQMANTRNEIYLMLGVGIVSGGIGIVYGHELIHQKNRIERALGEWLMISVLYGHFVTEHLLVHHAHVGTPNDAVTARYNESFYRFFARVIPQCFISAWKVEAARQRSSGDGRPTIRAIRSGAIWAERL